MVLRLRSRWNEDGEVSIQSDLLGSKFGPKCGDDVSYSSKMGAHNSSQKLHVNQAVCKMPNSGPAFLSRLRLQKKKKLTVAVSDILNIPLPSHSQSNFTLDPLSQCSKTSVNGSSFQVIDSLQECYHSLTW